MFADIDDCQLASAPCGLNSNCINTDGSFQCHCHQDFQALNFSDQVFCGLNFRKKLNWFGFWSTFNLCSSARNRHRFRWLDGRFWWDKLHLRFGSCFWQRDRNMFRFWKRFCSAQHDGWRYLPRGQICGHLQSSGLLLWVLRTIHRSEQSSSHIASIFSSRAPPERVWSLHVWLERCLQPLWCFWGLDGILELPGVSSVASTLYLNLTSFESCQLLWDQTVRLAMFFSTNNTRKSFHSIFVSGFGD